MKNRKNVLEEEPTWKKRRREMRKEALKSKMWMVIGAVVVAAVVVFMGYVVVRSMRPRIPKQLAKGKPIHAIARVTDKRVDRESGKTERWVSFRVGRFTVDQKVDEGKYDSLQKGQDVLMSYHLDPATRQPRIKDWKPYEDSSAAAK